MIDLDMDAIDKDGVIRHLAGLLKAAGYVRIEGYIRDVYLRGKWKGLQELEDMWRLLSGKSDYVDQVGIAVGSTRERMEWECCDGEPSQLFFLFAVPSDSKGAKDHLKLIAELAGKLGNDEIMKKLQNASTYEELVEAFS